MNREELWREAVRFHGHSCPGLAIGVRVALDYAAEYGRDARAEDEELVAVAETDACGVDGIQAILGCTAGKGNLWVRKRGKHVFTFFNRAEENGRRYSWIGFGIKDASHETRTEFFLSAPKDELYRVEPARLPLPPMAVINPSVNCEQCGEKTAEPNIRVRDGKMLCLDCAEQPLDLSLRLEL